MKVFFAALVLVGIGVAGMCFNILFRKGKEFPESDVGKNENMKKIGIRCMREEDDERFAASYRKSCTSTVSDSCKGCSFYTLEQRHAHGKTE